MKADAVNGL